MPNKTIEAPAARPKPIVGSIWKLRDPRRDTTCRILALLEQGPVDGPQEVYAARVVGPDDAGFWGGDAQHARTVKIDYFKRCDLIPVAEYVARTTPPGEIEATISDMSKGIARMGEGMAASAEAAGRAAGAIERVVKKLEEVPGSILPPGAVVGTNGATHYPPEGPAKQLEPGDTVPGQGKPGPFPELVGNEKRALVVAAHERAYGKTLWALLPGHLRRPLIDVFGMRDHVGARRAANDWIRRQVGFHKANVPEDRHIVNAYGKEVDLWLAKQGY